LNHIIALALDNEIYITCGLVDAKVNGEVSSEFMYIFDWKNKSVRTGPEMRIRRHACGAVVLKQVVVSTDKIIVDENIKITKTKLPQSWSEDSICILGGSVGFYC
jgi:hypothetical protein